MADVVVIGGGGHARVVIDALQCRHEYSVLGFFDGRQREPIFGIPCLGDDERWGSWVGAHPGCAAVMGIGSVGVEERRATIFRRLADAGFTLPAVVAASAVVSARAQLGDGTVVLPGAVVGPGARIGNGVIVNTRCSIDHDSVVEDFAHIAPGVTLCGDVRIGAGSFIGAGSTVIQGRTIAARCLIGAGSVVIDDVDDAGTYVGQPARRMT